MVLTISYKNTMEISYAHNPLLPEEHFVPDAEAHVWEDGRLYLYGSYDLCGNKSYCSGVHHVFSSDDMIHWIDHGVVFSTDDITWIDHSRFCALYAPDCAYRNGKYYLYYCIPDGRCGVAQSDSPVGPFKDVGQLIGVQGIDPAVLIDDDGQAYLYWGQFDRVRVARLKENMVEIEPDSVTQPLSVAEHDFHEGSSVKKIDGLYYYLYTDTHRHKDEKHPIGMATCLGYAVSDNPMTGFRYGGVVLDNLGCDPGTWNNHGSMECFRGQWYLFYHRSTHGAEFSRHVCAEPITVKGGRIAEVPMTTSGVGEAIPAAETIPGSLACGLEGHVRIAKPDGEEALALCEIRPGDAALFRKLSFDGETGFTADLTADGSCGVEILLDGEICGCFSGGSAAFDSPLTGVHTVTLRFTGDFTDARFRSFRFTK